MNKAELVAAMAEKTELSKKDAEAALKAFSAIAATNSALFMLKIPPLDFHSKFNFAVF